MIGVVGSVANETNVRLAAAWQELGIRARLMGGREARASLGAGDVALGRIDVLRTLDGVEPGLLDLLLLERRGIAVRNPPGALLAVHDKLLTAKRLAAAGIPHPRTGWVRSPDGELPVTPPLVVQPRFGSWGKDVFRCADEQEARRLLRGLAGRSWFRRHGALVQELLPSARDLRVLVAAGQVIGGIERVAAPGEWRSNVSLGGSRMRVVPDRSASELAILAAGTLGCDLVGVDLLALRPGGYVVLELNGAVDFDETYSLPGRHVFEDALRAVKVEDEAQDGLEELVEAGEDA